MLSQGVRTREDIKKRIAEYNQAVKEGKQYILRRFDRATPAIFFDSEFQSVPRLRWCPVDWCKITPELSQIFESGINEEHLISYNGKEAKEKLENLEFVKQCQSEVPKLLVRLAEIYLGMQNLLTRHYTGEIKEKVKLEIEKLNKEMLENIEVFMDKPSVISYIRKRIKSAKNTSPSSILNAESMNVSESLSQKVIRHRTAGIYTVQNICDLCNICKTTYYNICRKADNPNPGISRPPGRPLNENSLSKIEIERIKELVESPEKSYLIPEICEDIFTHFGHQVSKSKVYYQLTKKLRYSYKRNHFKPQTAFAPEQVIVRFEVCRKLLEIFKQGKNLIVMDETGWNLAVQREYSWAKIGKHPFRKKRDAATKRHVMMAITNHNVFAYVISSAGHNEHSYCNFMISMCKKLQELGPETVQNSIFYADNAPFHVSKLCKQLLKILQIPTLFSPVAACDFSPIEGLFAILKKEFKRRNVTNPYYFLVIQKLYRKLLDSEIFHTVNSLKPEIFLKLYMRILYYLEDGIKGIFSINCLKNT